MNGMFLVLLGLIWSRLVLSGRLLSLTFWLASYATFANWLATLLAAAWGAGMSMPIAAGENQGVGWQETIINFLLYSLSLAIISVSLLVLFGLRRMPQPDGALAAERNDSSMLV